MLLALLQRPRVRALAIAIASLGIVIGGVFLANSVFAATNAVTSGSCTAYVDFTSNVTMTQSGNDCILKVKAGTSPTTSGEVTQ